MMTLKDLIYVISSGSSRNKETKYILFNTDNGSWPPEYRYRNEHPAAIFRTLKKFGDKYNLLETEVHEICANTTTPVGDYGVVLDVYLNMYEDFVIKARKQGE